MKKLALMFVFLSACASVESAETSSKELMHSLGIEVSNIHCVRPIGAVFERWCTLKTVTSQVYTTHCIYNDCNVERGPGQ